MKIGELARRAEVSTDTLRFYEAKGLLRSDRRANGYRDFTNDTVELVRIIRLAQSLGFSLGEIGSILTELGGEISGTQVADLLRLKLSEIDARLAALTELRELVEDRLARACPLELS